MTPDELAKREPEPTWPIGFYAPGDYTCICALCGKQHIAAKRAVHCADCTLQACYREVERLRADYFAAEARGMERAAEIAKAHLPRDMHEAMESTSEYRMACHHIEDAIRDAAREIKP